MNKVKYYLLIAMTLLVAPNLFAQEGTEAVEPDSAMIAEFVAYAKEAYRMDSLLNYQYGKIKLSDGLATLTLDSTFKYLNPTETKKILEEAWGNPPQDNLGMIFPDSINPYMFDGWGVIVSYVEDGYIEDDDAASIDYDGLMDSMKEDMEEENELRKEMGYGSYQIIGWAETPYYDAQEKKLYWAKNLFFEGSEENTLNYDIRILGRNGYLQMNAVAGLAQLKPVKTSMQNLLARVQFSEGNTYFDFDPEVDEVAAYGIGALVAGKLAAKAGFFKVIGIFLAKFWKFILIGGGAIIAFVKKTFFSGPAEQKEDMTQTQSEA
ncbi:DUF2167 domain-containing protein [Reichenbachiella sp.]|uniref:DUF2167 domain-containing protein n=1 Tax=Reichenbachiella sp. TaxID=2184521 RepID=UPI003BAEC2E6